MKTCKCGGIGQVEIRPSVMRKGWSLYSVKCVECGRTTNNFMTEMQAKRAWDRDLNDIYAGRKPVPKNPVIGLSLKLYPIKGEKNERHPHR